MIQKVSLCLFLLLMIAGRICAQILQSDAGNSGGNYTIINYPGNFQNYYDGFSVIFRANHPNPNPFATINIANKGVTNIVNTAGNNVGINDILQNQIVFLIYDGNNSRFQMLTTSGNVSSGAGINGAGTANYLTKWSTASSLGSSVIFDDGIRIGIGTNMPQNTLDVEGGAVIGINYSGAAVAPTNGLLVQGPTAIGTNTFAPNAMLAIKDGHIQTLQSTVPTYSLTSNTTACTITGTDVAGMIQYTISPSGGTGAYINVGFNKMYSSGNPTVILTPQNSVAAAAVSSHDVYVASSSNGFTIYHNIVCNNATAICSMSCAYYYLVIDK